MVARPSGAAAGWFVQLRARWALSQIRPGLACSSCDYDERQPKGHCKDCPAGRALFPFWGGRIIEWCRARAKTQAGIVLEARQRPVRVECVG